MNPGQASSYSPSLAPGDLCEVVSHPDMDEWQRFTIGLRVILIRLAPPPCAFPTKYDPYWQVSGGPKPAWYMSHLILRKIQPPPLSELDELLDTFEDQKETENG